MSEQTELTTARTDVKRYQCRHIHADGHRCGSPSLKRQTFCFYHHTTRKPIPRGELNTRYAEQNRRAAFDLPLLEDRAAIQIAIGQILIRIAANQLDPKRAGLLLYGLQTASSNLPPHPRPQAEEANKPQQIIEEFVEDETYGPLAPEAELSSSQGPKSLEQILMEQWENDKEDWNHEMSAPGPHPIWTDEDEDEIQPIPNLQAVAESTLEFTGAEAPTEVEGLSCVSSLSPAANPTPGPECQTNSRLSVSRLGSLYPAPALPHPAGLAAEHKQKSPPRRVGFSRLCRRSPNLPHTYACSTIGPTRLNFRVRDGNGCDPRGKLTGKT